MITVQDKRKNENRDKSGDGLLNRFEAYALSHFRWFWKLVMAIPPLRRWANKAIINRSVRRARTRPHPLSSLAVRGDSDNEMAGYTSWDSLSDRNWFSRRLPQQDLGPYPKDEEIRHFFEVGPDGPVVSEDSTVLFLSFAQWFTDGFLMTDVDDSRKTHTSHHIDFNPLYGLTRQETLAIRLLSEASGKRGLLKFETDKDGEVYAPRYFNDRGKVKKEFEPLRPPLRLAKFLDEANEERAAQIRKTIFAFAGERANITPFTAMLNTLFLREHNHLAGLLGTAYPSWDDERVFHTARNINIVLLIKLVVEEYINHISPYHFQLTADPSVCWHAEWNKPNWIPIEFNLLYRWHSLTPSHFQIAGQQIPAADIVYDNSHLTRLGLGKAMEAASGQLAWNIGLFNTPDFLIDVEVASVKQGRKNHIGSYNDYREAFGFPRVTRFEQITGDQKRVEKLREAYKDVENVEFFVGLFAEDVAPRAAAPQLIARMVGVDAFSHALTNPLLSEHVYNDKTFTPEGMKVIADTKRLEDILNRNSPGGKGPYRTTMTYVT